jgi:hypothetical protein
MNPDFKLPAWRKPSTRKEYDYRDDEGGDEVTSYPSEAPDRNEKRNWYAKATSLLKLVAPP